MSFYPADLARIHDEGFGEFGRAAACELQRHLPAAGLVVELGCGTGVTTQVLARLGYELLGIDISSDMLAIARQRAPDADFREGSIWDCEIPPCIGVTAIGEVLNYAADERAGEERLAELFARIHAALRPGGVFVFDFATPGRAGPPGEHAGNGWRIRSETAETPGELERRMTIEIDGRTRVETHRLRLYERNAVQRRLEESGFTAEPLERYGDFEFWPGYAAFAARRSA